MHSARNQSSQCLGCVTSDLGLEGMDYLSPKSLAKLRWCRYRDYEQKLQATGMGWILLDLFHSYTGFDLRLCSNFQKDAKFGTGKILLENLVVDY